MVARRSVIQATSGFDPMLGAGTRFRCEDIDFVARASMKGYVGAHIPDLVVYHHHGRKPGEGIEKLMLDNDYARGSFFAKMILLGHFIYLNGWYQSIIKRRRNRLGSFFRELSGAIQYLIVVITKKIAG